VDLLFNQRVKIEIERSPFLVFIEGQKLMIVLLLAVEQRTTAISVGELDEGKFEGHLCSAHFLPPKGSSTVTRFSQMTSQNFFERMSTHTHTHAHKHTNGLENVITELT